MNNKDKKEARPFDGEHKTVFFEIIILVILGCLAILGTIALVFGLLVGLNIDTHFTCGGFLCSYYIIFVIVSFFTLWVLFSLIDKSKTRKKRTKKKKIKDFDTIY